MPLVTDYRAVKEIYAEAAERGIALPMYCAEDGETLEAILASALKMGEEIGVEDLPITPAWTCRYPHRPQMKFVTACGEAELGVRLMLSDLEEFMGDTSPYRKLRVMPHLDHGIPWLDGDILEGYADRFASVMCDASEKPFEENIRRTAEYVEKVKGRVVVEGAVDEIYESGGGGQKNEPTTVEQATRYIRETGVDVIVPNVGTEHRATADQGGYRGDRAREISRAVGKVMCIHGTSSVKPEDLGRLPADGFLKINIYTTLAVVGGQAAARNVLANLGNIFDEGQLRELVKQGVLTERVLEKGYGLTKGAIRPKLDEATNRQRRDAWFEAVRERCYYFLDVFHYRKFR